MAAPSLKIIFAGTPTFASIALEALTLSKHEVIAVYTQPDRASGRGLKVTKSPVKELAIDHDIHFQMTGRRLRPFFGEGRCGHAGNSDGNEGSKSVSMVSFHFISPFFWPVARGGVLTRTPSFDIFSRCRSSRIAFRS